MRFNKLYQTDFLEIRCACPTLFDALVAIPYEDPKAFDGKPEETAKYNERCKQIATETLYVFSKVKK